MRRRVKIVTIRGRDLKRGDVFRTPGTEGWSLVANRKTANESVSITYTDGFEGPGAGYTSWNPGRFDLVEVQR